MSVCLTFERWRNNPGTEFTGVVSTLEKKIQICPCVNILCKTREMDISRRRFAENEKDMHKN